MRVFLCAAGALALALGCGQNDGETGAGGGVNYAGGPAGSGGSTGQGGANAGTGGSSNGGTGGGSLSVGAQLDREALSGTRLKTRFLQADDGARQFYGFFDTQQQAACYFVTAEDSVQRCMPSVSAGGGYFVDSSCTTPGFTSPVCRGDMKYGLETSSTACGTLLYIYHSIVIEPSAQLYVKSGTTCQQTPTPGNTNVYRSTGKLPASTFVAAQVMTE